MDIAGYRCGYKDEDSSRTVVFRDARDFGTSGGSWFHRDRLTAVEVYREVEKDTLPEVSYLLKNTGLGSRYGSGNPVRKILEISEDDFKTDGGSWWKKNQLEQMYVLKEVCEGVKPEVTYHIEVRVDGNTYITESIKVTQEAFENQIKALGKDMQNVNTSGISINLKNGDVLLLSGDKARQAVFLFVKEM